MKLLRQDRTMVMMKSVVCAVGARNVCCFRNCGSDRGGQANRDQIHETYQLTAGGQSPSRISAATFGSRRGTRIGFNLMP
jgi:hypothetical protein